MVNWEFFDNQTPASARELVDELRRRARRSPRRAAPTASASFKEVSRVLAGFDDGRADEGVGAGTPTQRGTVLAQQMGWTAPDAAARPATAPARAAAGGGTRRPHGARRPQRRRERADAPAAPPGRPRRRDGRQAAGRDHRGRGRPGQCAPTAGPARRRPDGDDPHARCSRRTGTTPRPGRSPRTRRTAATRRLRTALAMQPEDVVTAVKDSGLRGRGGAGFPTG